MSEKDQAGVDGTKGADQPVEGNVNEAAAEEAEAAADGSGVTAESVTEPPAESTDPAETSAEALAEVSAEEASAAEPIVGDPADSPAEADTDAAPESMPAVKKVLGGIGGYLAGIPAKASLLLRKDTYRKLGRLIVGDPEHVQAAVSPLAAIPAVVLTLISASLWVVFVLIGPLNPYQERFSYDIGIVTIFLTSISFIPLAIHLLLEIYLWLGLRVVYFRSYLLKYRPLRAVSFVVTVIFWLSLVLWVAFSLGALVAPPANFLRDIFTLVFWLMLTLRYLVITPLLFRPAAKKDRTAKKDKAAKKKKKADKQTSDKPADSTVVLPVD